MRLGYVMLSGCIAAVSFGGGMLLGRTSGDEPETVTMVAQGKEENKNVPHDISIQSHELLTPTPIPSEEEERYLIMLSGDSICIYALLRDGKTDLVQKSDIDASKLRQEDYEELCRGITVKSLENAKSLCEDFGN